MQSEFIRPGKVENSIVPSAQDTYASAPSKVATSFHIWRGGEGSDYLFGTDVKDYTRGNGGSDVIYGEGGNDLLFGDAGDDWISGGSGNDNLTGGAGRDKLFGGSGNDRFVFEGPLDPSNVDTVEDFNTRFMTDPAEIDTIVLSKSTFAGLYDKGYSWYEFGEERMLDPYLFSTSWEASAQYTVDHIMYDQASGKLYFDPVGADAVQIAQFNPGTFIYARDIMIG